MESSFSQIARFLETVHPFDGLPKAEFDHVVRQVSRLSTPADASIFAQGTPLDGLYLVLDGEVEIRDGTGAVISHLLSRGIFGERGLLSDGLAASNARAMVDTELLLLPAETFLQLVDEQPLFSRFFARGPATLVRRNDMTTRKVGDLMSRPPVTCSPSDSVRQAAEIMRDRHVSCLGVVDGDAFVGIVTTRDLMARVLAAGLDPQSTLVDVVMTRDPIGLTREDLGSDVLHLMLERSIGHLPVVDGRHLVGMITQTDLTRLQAVSSGLLIQEIATANDVESLRQATSHIPQLLVQLVGGNNPHEVVTRLITDIADAVTRRLLAMAEHAFGAPPVPYLWLACGSQGRQEQTGVSDQDNCILIDDAFTEDMRPWFADVAAFVSRGLDACGYFFCPGDMMATNLRWCQPVSVWRKYFRDWISKPEPMAQMLASVMFDLRPIAGETALFANLQAETLAIASDNSIFVAHMIGNSLKHTPPLGLLRGFSTARSGEHRNQIDMKHSGIVPVVDLGRVYALIDRSTPVNTRARLLAAEETGTISGGGARDLVAAYDLIAEYRLRNQVVQVREGKRPDNYLNPYELGDFERSQLRDAFVVVRTMQSAIAHRGVSPV